jgi:hypothetical protein
MLATLKELQLATLTFFFCLFIFCGARISELVVALSDSPYERIVKWEICPILKDDRLLVRV